MAGVFFDDMLLLANVVFCRIFVEGDQNIVLWFAKFLWILIASAKVFIAQSGFRAGVVYCSTSRET